MITRLLRPLTKPKLKILLVWILANAVGGFLVGFLESNGAQFMATLMLAGAIVGSFQWLTFRWLNPPGLHWTFWPVVSALGWIVGTTFISLLLPLGDRVAATVESGFWEVFWLSLINQPLWIVLMAMAQGLILSYNTHQQHRIQVAWVLASCLGAAMHGAVSVVLCNHMCHRLPNTLVGIIESKGWAVYGVVTGITLLWGLGDNVVRVPLSLQDPD